jgi:hypothetical protein
MQNFTAADLIQTAFATLAFALFLVPPGYLLGLASNFFGMRSRSAEEQLLFSLALSFAATPILAVLLTRISSYAVTLSFFLLLAWIAVFLLARRWLDFRRRKSEVGDGIPRGSFGGLGRGTWLLLGMALAWFVVVQCSLADLQIGQRLYVNFVAFDHSVRVSFIEAAARNGVPPHNPFYSLGTAPVLRYFYYWYVVCALPVRLFGLSARASLNASVFWSGLALASLVPLFLKHLLGETEELRSKSAIGVALLTITGLDVIPYAFFAHRNQAIPGDMEWWDPSQVCSWMGSLLWVPHHVASLTACMVGLLALAAIDEESGRKQTTWAVIVAALAFASAAGLSAYVTFSFAAFVIVWTLVTLRQRRLRSFLAYLAIGAVVLLLSVPYLQDLMSRRSTVLRAGADPALADPALLVGGERFAYFAIRDYKPGMEFLATLGLRSEWLLELAKLPLLLYVYILEFGFFAVVLLLCWRRERQSPAPISRGARMVWTMLVVCLLTMSFLRSDTSGNNDLGFRGMLPVQFVLLLWAAPVVYEVFFRKNSSPNRRWSKFLLASTLVLGLAGTVLQLSLLRFYPPLADTGRVPRSEKFLGDDGFGERTYWIRAGFSELGRVTSPGAVVQYNPVRRSVLTSRLFSPRQTAMGDAGCGSAFGGDFTKCRNAFPSFAAVFNNPNAVRNFDLDRWCDEYKIDALVAVGSDPVWRDSSSWVWRRPPLVANPMMRAVRCGAGAGPPASKS